MQRAFALVLTLTCCMVFSLPSPRLPLRSQPSKVSIPELLSDDGFTLIEPAIVPEPEDGGRWWYTPSRKAHLHSQRSGRVIRDLMSKKANEELRLPGDVVPISYVLKMLPFIEEGNFTTDGEIEILVQIIKDTNSISISAADITVKQLSVQVVDAESNSPVAVVGVLNEQATREMITIQTAATLNEGKKYKISMKFISILNDELRGFYRSSYVENGVTKWLAVTQMESPDARRAFPCFDEPNMKATFSITLGRKNTMKTASNMVITSSEPIDGLPDYTWDHYETTPIMSSYLVVFLVSEFVAVAAKGNHRVPWRLWVKPESQALAEYSLTVGPAIQEHFEDYFQVPYPLPKQDLAAIPDFAAGAMENWGLITYKDNRLLIDVAKESRSRKQSVADINAHEIGHQWFGDLVTTDWWNTIWLNEGFATYVEFPGLDGAEPDMRLTDQFVVLELHYTFGVDALETSRPIKLDVTTPSEIDRMFDAISYDKGSCIIRMFADFVGLQTFNRGLTRYLNAKSYKNAVQEDLWQAIQEQVDQEQITLPTSTAEIMDTWTLQMGFPLITVTRDYESGRTSVSQNRFLQRKNPDSTDTHDYKWWVPLTYVSNSDFERKSDWLSDKEDSKTIENVGASSNWVIFNYDQQNYYRVIYDDQNYRLIAEQLLTDHTLIRDNNRAQLLDDAFVVASAHMLPYKQALDLTDYLKKETEYVPWNAVLAEFNYIDSMLYDQSQYADWKSHLISLVEPYYNYVGFQEFETDAHLTVFSRSDAMSWACRLGIQDCVTIANAKYAELMADPNNSEILSPNQKSVILRTGVENGGKTEWDFAFEQYKTKLDTAFLIAATSSQDESQLKELLEMMLKEDSGIRLSDVNTLFNNVASNPVGNAIATDFLVNQWEDIEASRLGTSYFVNFFRYLCNRQNTQQQLDTLLKLREDHSDILGSSNTVQQGIDVVTENIKWMTLHQEEIGFWLKKGTTTDSSTKQTPEATTEPTSSTTTTEPSTTSTTTTTSAPETTTVSAGNSFSQINVVSLMMSIVILAIGKFLTC